MYLSKCIKPDNYTLAAPTSVLKRTFSTSVCHRVRGANRRCREIVPGPRSRPRGGRLNDTAYTRNFSDSEVRVYAIYSPTKPSNGIEHRLGVPLLLQHLGVDRSRDEVVIGQRDPSPFTDLAFLRPGLLPNGWRRGRFGQVVGEDLAEESGAIVRISEEGIRREGIEERSRDWNRVQWDRGWIRSISFSALSEERDSYEASWRDVGREGQTSEAR
jgi:hypothetical protein